jgi:tRNA pseudouridine55 synthase
LNGFLNILKPPGLTSHDVVEYIRGRIKVKVGHGGTLDPGAAGVLPVLLGKATRLSSYLVDFPKIYRAELFLGLSTDTADASGKIIRRASSFRFNFKDIEEVFCSFEGEIMQIPPMFAAVKHRGKKLYEYARQGTTVERNPKAVHIYYIKILDYFPPQRIYFEVKCSKGTYIRTLCSQIGDALGCGGHMAFLLRKEVGPFVLSESHILEEFSGRESYGHLLLPLDFLFQKMDYLMLGYEDIRFLSQGSFLSFKEVSNRAINVFSEPADDKIVPVYTPKKEFAVLARWKCNHGSGFFLKPEKVFQTIKNKGSYHEGNI